MEKSFKHLIFFVLLGFIPLNLLAQQIGDTLSKNPDSILVIHCGTIKVVGTAYDDGKPFACIQTKTNHFYYLENLMAWPEKVVGKKVKVTGTASERTCFRKALHQCTTSPRYDVKDWTYRFVSFGQTKDYKRFLEGSIIYQNRQTISGE